MIQIDWKIFYDNGSTYHGDPFLAPGLGVIAIVNRDSDHGRYIRVGHDYYWYEDSKWGGGDIFGLFDYLVRPGARKIIFGRTTDNQTFARVYQQALDDPDFLPKTAYSYGEIHP
jgi:hypothetical protein